jgi:hypothetical protein
VGALCPALSLLHDTLNSQATAEAVEERALQSLNDTLLCLFQVPLADRLRSFHNTHGWSVQPPVPFTPTEKSERLA